MSGVAVGPTAGTISTAFAAGTAAGTSVGATSGLPARAGDGITSHCPTTISCTLRMLLADASAATVTPFRRAIEDSESPLRTW